MVRGTNIPQRSLIKINDQIVLGFMRSLQLLYLPLINQTDIEKFQKEEADDEIDATNIILLDSDKADEWTFLYYSCKPCELYQLQIKINVIIKYFFFCELKFSDNTKFGYEKFRTIKFSDKHLSEIKNVRN